MSVLGASTSTSVIPWPDFAKTQDKAEQIQFIYFSENVQLPYVPQLPRPPIPAHPQFFISGLQEERPIQSRSTPFSAFRPSSYLGRHISVYEPRPTVQELLNGPEPSLNRPEPAPSSKALQQQPSEHMDVDHPRQLIPEPPQPPQAQAQQVSLALDWFPPAYTSYNPPVTQDQFALRQFSDAQRSQCSSYAPGFSSPPVVGHMSAPPVASDQEGHRLPTILTASVSQSQPLQDHHVTEPSAFNGFPDAATAHVDLSFHPAAAPPPYSQYSGSTSVHGMLADTRMAWHPAPAEYAPAQPQALVQNIPQGVTPPASSPHQQPDSIPRPSSPADSVRATGEI